jgi:hypothetical protein
LQYDYLDDVRSKKKRKIKKVDDARRFLEEEASEASDYDDSGDDSEKEIKDHENQYYRPEELAKRYDSRDVLKKIEEKAKFGEYGDNES